MKSRSTVDPRGFSLIELLVSIVIIGILASAVFPMMEISFQRAREQDLRVALRSLRNAIDAYRQAVEDGKIVKKADESGYPHRLEDLAEGVPDARDPKGGRIVFLRRIPRDPLADDLSVPAAQTWGKRSYVSTHEDPREGSDVFDIYSLAAGSGLNGVPYRQW